MKGEFRAFGFVTVVALVCSILLAGADQLAGPRKLANEKTDEVRSILTVMAIEVPAKASAAELTEIFERNVRISESQGLTLYAYHPEGRQDDPPVAVAVPFSGPGLWGTIYGIMALEPDLRTIRAVRFYKQEETPGLGGEIGGNDFQQRFIDKQIVSASGQPSFRVTKPGSSPAQNAVDGISGATMTCDRVQLILDTLATQLSEVRNTHGG